MVDKISESWKPSYFVDVIVVMVFILYRLYRYFDLVDSFIDPSKTNSFDGVSVKCLKFTAKSTTMMTAGVRQYTIKYNLKIIHLVHVIKWLVSYKYSSSGNDAAHGQW